MIRLLAVLTFVICGVVLAAYLLVRAGLVGRPPKRDQLYEAARWPVPLDSEEARRNRRMVLTLAIVAATILVAFLLGWVYLRESGTASRPCEPLESAPSQDGWATEQERQEISSCGAKSLALARA